MSSILFIELKRNYSGLRYVEVCKNMKMRLTLFTYSIDKYKGIAIDNTPLLDFFDVVEQVDTTNLSELRKRVIEQNHEFAFDIILGTMDMELKHPAVLSKELGLRGTNPTAIELTRNKFLMQKHLQKYGLESLPCAEARTLPAALQAGAVIGYPVIMKPMDGFGSCDVALITSDQEMESYFYRNVNQMQSYDWRHNFEKDYYVCEKFISGQLYSIELLVHKNEITVLGFTSRLLSPLPYFAEMGAFFPASPPEVDKITAYVKAAVQALNFDFGIAHVEFIINGNDCYLVDFNPRMPGSLTSIMMQSTLGVDLHQTVIEMYLGKAPQIPAASNGYALLYSIVPTRSGTLTKVSIDDQTTSALQVLDLHINAQLGAQVTALPTSNDDTVIDIALWGETRDSVWNDLSQFINGLQLEVDGASSKPSVIRF